MQNTPQLQNAIFALHMDELNDLLADKWYEKLSPKRQEKIAALQDLEAKRRSLMAGILLQIAAERYGLSTPQEGGEGKPNFFGEQAKANLSHSGEIAVLALSSQEVGVDIEKVRSFSPALCKKVFTDKERAWLAQQTDYDTACTKLWTAKESALKYLGCGLSLAPSKIEAQADGRLISEADGLEDCRWTGYSIEGYALTVCAKDTPFTAEIIWIHL